MQWSNGKSQLLSSFALSSRTGLHFNSLSVGLVVKPNRVYDAQAGDEDWFKRNQLEARIKQKPKRLGVGDKP